MIRSNDLLKFMLIFIILSFAVPLNPLWTVQKKTLSKQMDTVEEGMLTRQVSLLCLGGYALVILFNKRKYRFHINGYYGILMIFFLLWAALSIFWADDIYTTLKRITALLLLSLGAFAISLSLSFQKIAEFTFFSCSITLLLGLISEVLLGTFQPFAADYRFSGVFHANTQGQNCAVLFAVSIFLSNILKRRAFLFRMVGIIAFIFLILTKSRVAALSGILAIILGWIMISHKVFKKILLILYVPLFIIFMGFVVYGEDIILNIKAQSQNVITLGRQRDRALWTFVDRRIVWDESMQFVFRKPFTGYGYGSFWTPGHIATFTAAVGRGLIASAHSAYIDMLLSIGFIGAFIYIFVILGAIKKSIALYRNTKNRVYAITSILIIWLFFNSIFESIAIKPYIHIFVVFVLITKLAFNVEEHSRGSCFQSRVINISKNRD